MGRGSTNSARGSDSSSDLVVGVGLHWCIHPYEIQVLCRITKSYDIRLEPVTITTAVRLNRPWPPYAKVEGNYPTFTLEDVGQFLLQEPKYERFIFGCPHSEFWIHELTDKPSICFTPNGVMDALREVTERWY